MNTGRRDLLVSMGLLTPVVQDRLILNRSGAGTPELQRGTMPASRRDILVPIGLKIETGRSLLPEESRPGGLSYGNIACIETGRSLLPEEIGI